MPGKVYGNWCGPNYGSGVPVDEVDAVCRDHDLAVDRIGPKADPVRGVDGDGTSDDMELADLRFVWAQRKVSRSLREERPKGWRRRLFWAWIVQIPFVWRLRWRGYAV